MSATVETDYVYSASCPDCHSFGPASTTEEEAEEWAANHDAENHAEDDGEDEKCERFKEWRRDGLL